MQNDTQSKDSNIEYQENITENLNFYNFKTSPYLIPGSILMGSILISLSIIFSGGISLPGGQGGTGGGGPAINEEVQVISERDVILGDPEAPVTLIEYGDYQCPFCARFFANTEQHIRENYISKGLVRMVFRNFQFLGPESVATAEAAECAKDQGNFWGFHDAIYTEEFLDGVEHNENLNRDLFMSIAGELGMDTEEFASCVDSVKYAERIAQDRNEAQLIGVNSTPVTFINGRLIEGAVPTEQFVAEIERALSESR